MLPRMRVVFLGNDPWSVASLEELDRSGLDVVLVATRAPQPAGRGSGLRPTAVAEAARRLGLPLAEVESVRMGGGLEALRAADADALVVVAYGEILTTEVLDLPRIACVNAHFSLLPRWRGATPVQHAILAGDTVTGVTTMRMDRGLDTGPILLRVESPVSPDDDAGTLGERLAELAGPLVRATLERLAAGDLTLTRQPSDGVTYAPKLSAPERWID